MSWLDDLDEKERRATPGEWVAERFGAIVVKDETLRAAGAKHLVRAQIACVTGIPDPGLPETHQSDNAALIAASRNALPRLLRIARAAEEFAAVTDECEQTISNDYLTAKYWAALKALREAVRDAV